MTLPIPQYLFIPAAAILGLLLGSFYSVCVYRYIEEIPMLKPKRSFCPSCQTRIAWYENIPLISYYVLEGKCLHCGERIGFRYVALEAVSAIWAALLAWKFGPSELWLVYMIFGGAFIFASFVDIEIYILPDRVTIGGSVLAVAVAWFLPYPGFMPALMGAALGGGGFLLLQFMYRIVRKEEGLGTGDVKLMFCIGALVGPWGLPFTILVAGVVALVVSVAYVRGEDGDGLRTQVPFGPFLALGCMTHILIGREVMQWYLGFYG